MNIVKNIAASVLALIAAGTTQAAVVDSADISGVRTFTDTNTGFVWADLDNYFDSVTGSTSTTPASMIASLQAAGFSVATGAQVHQLLDSLPLSGGEYSSYAAVMGSGQPRQLIWGLFGTEASGEASGSMYSWAYAFSYDSAWNFNGISWDANNIPNSAGDQDLGIWAVQAVPEPSTYAMLLAGLGMLGFAARRKRA